MFLERLCKRYDEAGAFSPAMQGHRCLMDRGATDGSETAVYARAVDIVPMGRGAALAAVIVSTIHGLLHSERDQSCSRPHESEAEWMYVLNRAREDDPHKDLNAGFRAVLQGKLDAALTTVAGWNEERDVDRCEEAVLQYTVGRLNALNGMVKSLAVASATGAVATPKLIDPASSLADALLEAYGPFVGGCW